MEKEFYSIKEVAQMIGVSTNTIHNWLKKDKLPYVQISAKTIRIPAKGLQKFLEEKKHND
jgi:excisionase family DNA binding protein